MDNKKYIELKQKAIEMVMVNIKGERKGMPGVPNYIHSLRVGNLLKVYKFNLETILAGFLHDLVEDGCILFDELERQGFPAEVIDTVRLCTHNIAIKDNDERWKDMVAGLVVAGSRSAWAVKLADVFDNLMDSHTLPVGRGVFMREHKIPVLLSSSANFLKDTGLWDDLNNANLKTIRMIREISKKESYVRNEIKNGIELPKNVQNELLALCDKVDGTNRGVSSEELRNAIILLHDTAERFSKGLGVDSLELLADSLCGDMLAHWSVGNEIRIGYKIINSKIELDWGQATINALNRIL
jgi:hypothetical protein